MSTLRLLFGAIRRFYVPVQIRRYASEEPSEESAEVDLDCKFEALLDKGDIDGWELRKRLDEIHSHDYIPSPGVMNAALRACRRVNDFALAMRFLETTRYKSMASGKKIWPYLLQEIDPTLKELGIDTPEGIGYDKPELALAKEY